MKNFWIYCCSINVSPPLLAHPESEIFFILHTDALSHSFGRALYQIQDGKLKVTGYDLKR